MINFREDTHELQTTNTHFKMRKCLGNRESRIEN